MASKLQKQREVVDESKNAHPGFIKYVVEYFLKIVLKSFRNMRTNVYMESDSTMEERIHRNVHYVQRNPNVDNFIRK